MLSQATAFIKGNRIAVTIYLFAALTYVFYLDHGLPNHGETWAKDGDPLHSIIVFKGAFLNGWNSGFHQLGYPDLHRVLVFILQSPYLLYLYMTGQISPEILRQGFPYDKYSFQLIYRDLGVINRMTSVAMALGTIFWVGKTAQYLSGNVAKMWAMFTMAVSPAVVYYVHTDTLDVPMLFWLAAAFYYYLRALTEGTLRAHVVLGILAAVSTSTKYYAYGAFVLMPIPLIVMKFRQQEDCSLALRVFRSLFDRRHVIGLLAFGITFVITENILWNPSGFVSRIDYALAISDETTTVSLSRTDWVSWRRLMQLAAVLPFVVGWPGAILSAISVVHAIWNRRHKLLPLAWPCLGLYVFTVVPCLEQHHRIERPFMPLAIALSTVVGCQLAEIWGKARLSNLKAAVFRVGCLIGSVVMIANAVAMDLLLANDTRLQAERYFARIPPSQSVALFGYRRQLPRLHGLRRCWVINHRPRWYSRDVQINDQFDPDVWLMKNQPDYVVLATNYAGGWSGEMAKRPEAGTMRMFFNSLRKGEQQYVLVKNYHPFLGCVFGMPRDREHVPRLEIYARRQGALE